MGAQLADGSDSARVRAASVSPAGGSDHARRSLLRPRARWARRKIEQRGAGQLQWEVVVERTMIARADGSLDPPSGRCIKTEYSGFYQLHQLGTLVVRSSGIRLLSKLELMESALVM